MKIGMSFLWKALGAMALCGALAGSAGAVTYTSGGEYQRRGINARQHHQQQRIAQGIRSGELTPREAARLEREEGRFAREEHRLRQDGLTGQERARLERQESRMSRQIYRQKHDRQGR